MASAPIWRRNPRGSAGSSSALAAGRARALAWRCPRAGAQGQPPDGARRRPARTSATPTLRSRVQEQAMRCLTNYARAAPRPGARRSADARKLDRSAATSPATSSAATASATTPAGATSPTGCGGSATSARLLAGRREHRLGQRPATARVRSIFRAWLHSAGAPREHPQPRLRPDRHRPADRRASTATRERPRLDPALRRPLLSAAAAGPSGPRIRACPRPSTSATATASPPPS